MGHARATIWTLLDRREVSDWVHANEDAVADFQFYVRTLNPRTWQEEFISIILDSADVADGDECAEPVLAD